MAEKTTVFGFQKIADNRVIQPGDYNSMLDELDSRLAAVVTELGGNISVPGTVTAAGGTLGNLTVTSNLTSGNLTGTVTMTGNASVSGTLGVTGAVTVNNATLGNVTMGGTLGVTGLVTQTLMPRLPESNLAATGTNLATAAQLVAGFVTVSAADGTVGVKLPATPATGTWAVIKNNAGSALKVYPDAAATINAIGSNGAISMAANTSAMFFADSATQWWTVPLLPS